MARRQQTFWRRRGKLDVVERKIFWLLFTISGLALDLLLPIYWSLALTLPLLVLCWWVAYRSGWFG